MFNLFKRPIEPETLDDWAKMAANIAQVSVLAIPVVLYGKDPLGMKLFNSLLLLVSAYAFLQSGRIIRRYRQGNQS